MSAPAPANPNTATPNTSFPAGGDSLPARVERWHGVADAASLAIFGVSFINTTTAARAAWWEVSKFVLGLSQQNRRDRKTQRPQ